jgi:hypothetical protein
MKPVFSELTVRQMLELTKAALHGSTPDEKLFTGAGEADWNALFDLCVAQGVMSLSFEGAMRLPKDLQPPRTLKLSWIAGVEAVKKKYRHSRETAEALAGCFRENNIRMMVFKGLALSRLYPVPESREFGDMDIYLCGKAVEGDALLKRISDKKHVSSGKDVSFSYRKVLIENHHTFLYHGIYKKFHKGGMLEDRLKLILAEAGILEEISNFTNGQEEQILLFPPPEFDALHTTLHTLSHLVSGIVVRHLCDLTMIFTEYKGKIVFSLYRHALSEAGLTKLAGILISLSVRHLGLNPDYVPPYETDISLENRIWNDLLNPISPPSKAKRNLFNVFIHKIRLLQTQYWKYELVFPGQFVKGILYSTYFHLRYPKTIRNL